MGRTTTTNEVLRGLIYTHNRANANTAEVHEANATLQTLLEMLVERGLVDPEAFEEKRKQASEQLRRQYVERGMAVAMQEFGVSKYEFQGGTEIDCENRIHLCKAVCCRRLSRFRSRMCRKESSNGIWANPTSMLAMITATVHI